MIKPMREWNELHPKERELFTKIVDERDEAKNDKERLEAAVLTMWRRYHVFVLPGHIEVADTDTEADLCFAARRMSDREVYTLLSDALGVEPTALAYTDDDTDEE